MVDADFDLDGLPAHLSARLPDYARPVFLRIASELAMTETFKQKKQALADEGFDPCAIADPLYVFESGTCGYVGLDIDRFERIVGGAVRL